MRTKLRCFGPFRVIDTFRNCKLRPILVHTLDRAGDWTWSIGFRIGDDITKNAGHIMRFEGTIPMRATIEHHDHRTSASYWFELWEIERAVEQVVADYDRWCGESIVRTWRETIATLEMWGMVAIEQG